MTRVSSSRDGSEGAVSAEAGSLPLTLLAALILGGLVVAVGISVSTGTDSAQHDRDFNAAIHVADAGVQQAYSEVIEHVAATEPAPGDPPIEGEGTIDGLEYRWVAEYQGGMTWEVRSTGGRGGSQRTVVAELSSGDDHALGIYAEQRLRVNGMPSGGIAAYDEDGNEVDLDYLLGTSGIADPRGNCQEGFVLYDGAYDEQENDAVFNCDPEPIPGGELDLDDDPAAEAFSEGGACIDENGEEIDDWASGGGGGGPPHGGGGPPHGGGPSELERGESYCAPNGVTVGNGQAISVTGDDAEPARVYLKGDAPFVMSSGNTKTFNVPVPTADLTSLPPSDVPDASAVHVYMSAGGEFSIGPNSYFAGYLWNPRGTCVRSGTNTSFGSLICDEFTENGQWNHWYDVRIDARESGALGVTAYREDPSMALP